MKVEFLKKWAYAPNGNTTEIIGPGEVELPDSWAKRAIAAGAAVEQKASRAPRNKAKKTPRNKAQ